MKSIYIYGASGHGLVVADIAKANGYTNIIFIDDGDNAYQTFEEIKNKNDIPLALGIGSNKIRKSIYKKAIQYGFDVITLVHPSAIISTSTKIDAGTVVMPNVVVNACSSIGKGVILNTACVIDHENIIEDFVHISPNVALAGNVIVNSNTHIGIGTSVIQGLIIGENCIIGAGSVVVKNIAKNYLAYGNPCIAIKEINE
ncbi:acetyltransferase [Sulfurospirillum oryzae]|uniref:acetyltransferase n=1 Tax=Sulfurospirillum oryzae TaxID=2976535 RepID=UPI0021E7CA8B|nr:acetyltransferase [Sulfurospirillum oryzae]